MNITLGDGVRTPYLFAILSPHRSLTQKGFALVMAFFGVASILIGGIFLLLGAWPIFGFFGVDVLLLYLAFRSNYKDGGVHETVLLTDDDLAVTHRPLSGPAQSWQFNPYWVRFELLERRGRSCLLQLSSHGRRLAFGNFLSDDEKREFAARMRTALASLRAA